MASRKRPTTTDAVQNLRFKHSTGKASPIELLRVSDLRKRDSGISNPTRLDFHIIQFVISERGRHWVDFEPIKLGRGDLLHIQAD